MQLHPRRRLPRFPAQVREGGDVGDEPDGCGGRVVCFLGRVGGGEGAVESEKEEDAGNSNSSKQ